MSTKYTFNTKSSVSMAFREIMLQEIKRIQQWRKTAIKGKDPEGVHQIRVSLRRLRTALILFKPLLNTSSSKHLSKKLKKYATTLDKARDMDVFIILYLNSDSDNNQLSELAVGQRKKAYKKVRKLLKSDRFKQFFRDCTKWLKNNDRALTQASNISLPVFAAQTLEQYRQKVIQQAETLDLTDEKALHQLRISCKKLRYACEFFGSLYAKKTITPFLKQLEQLQESLGTIHDCFVHKQLHQILMAKHDVVTAEHELQQHATQLSMELKAGLIEKFASFKLTPVPWHTD